MTQTIRPANNNDLTALVALLNACADGMSAVGMHHWQDVYDFDAVKANLTNKQMFVIENTDQLLGCVALGSECADYYKDCWPQAPTSDYYLTQLAVAPEFQGLGLGKLLVQHCIALVGSASLQLDAVDHYPALNEFYHKLGFEIIATGIGLGDKRHLYRYRRDENGAATTGKSD